MNGDIYNLNCTSTIKAIHNIMTSGDVLNEWHSIPLDAKCYLVQFILKDLSHDGFISRTQCKDVCVVENGYVSCSHLIVRLVSILSLSWTFCFRLMGPD